MERTQTLAAFPPKRVTVREPRSPHLRKGVTTCGGGHIGTTANLVVICEHLDLVLTHFVPVSSPGPATSPPRPTRGSEMSARRGPGARGTAVRGSQTLPPRVPSGVRVEQAMSVQGHWPGQYGEHPPCARGRRGTKVVLPQKWGGRQTPEAVWTRVRAQVPWSMLPRPCEVWITEATLPV